MMKRFLAIGIALAFAFGASLAMAQGAAALHPPSQADKDAVYAVGAEGDRTIAPLQKKMLDNVLAHGSEKQFCDDATQVAAASRDRVQKVVAYLRKLQAGGTSTTEFESLLLVWSSSADDATNRQLEQCAEARYPDDDDAQSAQYLRDLLASYATAKAEKLKAQTDNDRLTYLLRLQTMHTCLREVLDYFDIVHRLAASDPKVGAVMAQEPALRAEYATVHDKYQRKIAPILHPGAPDPDAPFVYRPVTVPDVPDNDQAFYQQGTGVALGVLQSLNAALKPSLMGDFKSACAYARLARTDAGQLKTYGQAYLKKRQDAGGDTAAAAKFLQQQDSLSAQIDQGVDSVCAPYRSSAPPQALYDEANAGLTAADAKQNLMVDALNSAIADKNEAGQCQTSRDLRTLLEQKMISLELIKVLVEPDGQKPDKAAYLAKINDIQDKTRGLLQKVLAVEDKTCAASIQPDMTLD